VPIGPRNLTTKPQKSGKNDDALFSKPSYNHGDLFQEAAVNILRTDVKDGHLKYHDRAFSPAKVVPYKPHLSPYSYKSDLKVIKKNFCDEEGAVIVGPRNFFTTPTKKGIVARNALFSPFPDHVPDDYNYPKKVM